MNEPLHRFHEVMLVSSISCVLLGALLLLLTVWRPYLRKWLEAEAGFWKRLGLKGNWSGSLRQFEESRTVVVAVAGLLILHLVLLISAASANAYFSSRLRNAKSGPVQPPAAKTQPME